MARQDTYADVDAAAGDKVLGRDVSDTTQNAAGSTKELNVESIALTVDAAAMRSHLNVEDGATADGAAEVKTANYTVVVGDAGKTIAMNNAGATIFTLNEASFTNGEWVDLMSIGDGATTVSGNGLNAAGQDSLVLRKGDRVRVTFLQSADPSWLVEYWEDVVLDANEQSVRNSADNGYEGRLQKGQIGATIVWDAVGGPWPIGVLEYPALVRGGNVILIPDSTASGVTVKIYKNGTEINGFATAQAVNYNAGAGVYIATTETFAAGDIVSAEIVAATAIAHVLIRIPLTRTGD